MRWCLLIKLTGMLLLISAGLLLGRGHAASLWDKARACREMEEAALLLASQMGSRQPLGRICLSLGSSTAGRAGEFFRVLGLGLDGLGESGLRQLWSESAHSVFGGALSRNELARFENLGAVISLGQAVDEGAGHCAEQLRRMAEKAEERANRDGRMYTGLGAALGAALSIMLV